MHAEISAINKVRNKNILHKCKIYVIRITEEKIIQGYPCNNCLSIINKYNLTFKELNLNKY